MDVEIFESGKKVVEKKVVESQISDTPFQAAIFKSKT